LDVYFARANNLHDFYCLNSIDENGWTFTCTVSEGGGVHTNFGGKWLDFDG